MKKVRTLHVVQSSGSVDRYIQMLLKYLDKNKFENILVCSQDFHEENYEGLVDYFEQIKMTRAIIGLRNYCVYNPHGWAFNMQCSAKKKMMYTAIEKIAAPFCDKIICISDAEKQSALRKKICIEEKFQVIFNGVDIEAYENSIHGTIKRGELNIPEDAFAVGMVGRMSPQKAPDIFVKMVKLVKDKILNAHFIIVDSGDQEAEIRKYAGDNGFLDNLHITGRVDEPMRYVELFDVESLLSRWEGFGLVLPEYMMVGKPIVAS